MNRLLSFLANERTYKLSRMHAISSGWATLYTSADGVTHDITDEELRKLRADVEEIDQLLRDEGCSLPDS